MMTVEIGTMRCPKVLQMTGTNHNAESAGHAGALTCTDSRVVENIEKPINQRRKQFKALDRPVF